MQPHSSYARRDHPLKIIIEDNATIFCRDFLGLELQDAKPLNIEFKNRTRFLDTLLELRLPDNSLELVHIELQSQRSHMPMAIRMLDYFVLVSQKYRQLETLPLRSFVIYLEDGAGADDTGDYQLGKYASGRFHYGVIHLWKLPAQELLDMQQPVLLTLIGQTKFHHPRAEMQQALDYISQTSDAQAGELLALMGALIEDKELATMVEHYIIDNDFLNRSPLLQSIYQRGWQECLVEIEGDAYKGAAKQPEDNVLQQVFVQGKQAQQRENIVDVFLGRFTLQWSRSKDILRQVEKLAPELLAQALLEAATVEAPESFEAWLERASSTDFSSID